MKPIYYQYRYAQLSEDQIIHAASDLISEIEMCSNAHQDYSYSSPYSFLALCSDSTMHQDIAQVAERMRALNPSMLIVLGIGGSHLGIQAIHEALHGFYYNERAQRKVYFVDTVDSYHISDVMAIARATLEKNEQIVLVIISKSGSTLETAINMEIFVNLLQQYRSHAHEYIIAITDKSSLLYQQAQAQAWRLLTIPKQVGGRYSVFSAVGLFPLHLLEIDIEQLCAGAQQSIHDQLHRSVVQNRALQGAAIHFLQYQQGRSVHDMFLFCKQLHCLGLWYRQLIAESLGKKNGMNQPVGLMPTISMGSSDLHSVIQLYLGGPLDVRFTTFLTLVQDSDIFVHYKNKPTRISDIMCAIARGVQDSYTAQQLPWAQVIMPSISEYYIGYFMQWQMIQTIYLGCLLRVNPFDQPQVELYKAAMRKRLDE